MIVLNTPHNPVGKVFTRRRSKASQISQRSSIAGHVRRSGTNRLIPVFVQSDAPQIQYDCLVYDGEEHVRIATLPGMWERTVTVGSAGSKFRPTPSHQPIHICIQTESFAATGWRVGWLIGPESDHQTHPRGFNQDRILLQFASPGSCRGGLERAKNTTSLPSKTKEYAERRDTLVKVFDDLGMKYTLPQGSYFVLLVVDQLF
jgi:kynurenine aminotransferase